MLRKFLEKLDLVLLSLVFCLIVIGIIALYSASSANMGLISHQLVHIAIGAFVMIIIAMVPYYQIKDCAPYLYAFGNLLLIFVLALGYISKGAQRWLGFGAFHVQPSEFMKVFSPLCLCWFFDHRECPPRLKSLAIGILIALAPFYLVYKQPDLGTALVLLTISGIAILLSGVSRQIIYYIVLLIALTVPLMWHYMHGYQKKRILIFLNPESDPLGAGYHIMQSKIAVGSGGFWGKGFLQGSQVHLNFLPEHTTDFIFAVIAEEFGFIGCVVVILLVLSIALRMIFLGYKSLEGFSRNACVCLGCLFFISALINMSMVVGLLPVVGIPLPLVSYGGSNMLITFISIGIVMSLKNNWQNKRLSK